MWQVHCGAKHSESVLETNVSPNLQFGIFSVQDQGEFVELCVGNIELSMENGEDPPRDDELRVTNVKVCVEPISGDAASLAEQVYPALLLGSQKAIPKVVKHIYSHLAAYSRRIDEGVPDIIISLIAAENIIDLQVITFQIFYLNLNC